MTWVSFPGMLAELLQRLTLDTATAVNDDIKG